MAKLGERRRRVAVLEARVLELEQALREALALVKQMEAKPVKAAPAKYNKS